VELVTKSKLYYLKLPVLVKVSFGREAIKGYVNASPSLSPGLAGKQTVKGGPNGGEMNISFGDPSNDTAFISITGLTLACSWEGEPALEPSRVQ
jgi:hypothetical protein